MAWNLSEATLAKDGLGAFRRLFEETRLILETALPSIQCKLSFQKLHDGWGFICVFISLMYMAVKNLLLDLILDLQNQPAPRIILSRNSRGTLREDHSAYVV